MSSKNRAGKHRLHATCTERGSGTSVPLSVAGSISSRDFSNMFHAFYSHGEQQIMLQALAKLSLHML